MAALGVSPLVGQLADRRARLEQLVHEAALLDGRARQMAIDEEQLAESRRGLDREAESIAVQLTELQEREKQVEGREGELRRAWTELDDERTRLEAESERIAFAEDQLAQREQRYVKRWRWLIGCLTFLRLRRSSASLCDVLMVPTLGGYRLLEQSGLAVEPGAVLRGLVDDYRQFEVTKIARMPLEDRVCAYLQETTTKEGEGT